MECCCQKSNVDHVNLLFFLSFVVYLFLFLPLCVNYSNVNCLFSTEVFVCMCCTEQTLFAHISLVGGWGGGGRSSDANAQTKYEKMCLIYSEMGDA